MLQQQGFRVLGAVQQGVLQIQQIRGGFRQLLGDLMQLGVLIHFQRIKVFVDFAPFHALLIIGHDLRFRFRIQTAQLFVEALYRVAHFLHVEGELGNPLLYPTAVNGGFPGQIHQRFQYIGPDPHHFLGLRLVLTLAAVILFRLLRLWLLGCRRQGRAALLRGGGGLAAGATGHRLHAPDNLVVPVDHGLEIFLGGRLAAPFQL